MTPAEALREAAQAGRYNQFDLDSGAHAALRMRQRSVRFSDIRHALQTATVAISEPEERWRLEGGATRDGDPLTLVVVFEWRCVVITVF